MELVIRHSVLRQLHVLLIEQEERTMQLIACRVIDPARTLSIGNAVRRVGCRTHSPRFGYEVRLGTWIARQEFIERWMSQDAPKTLGKRPVAIARCRWFRKQQNLRELNRFQHRTSGHTESGICRRCVACIQRRNTVLFCKRRAFYRIRHIGIQCLIGTDGQRHPRRRYHRFSAKQAVSGRLSLHFVLRPSFRPRTRCCACSQPKHRCHMRGRRE